jgi:hypothetical protein
MPILLIAAAIAGLAQGANAARRRMISFIYLS